LPPAERDEVYALIEEPAQVFNRRQHLGRVHDDR